MELDWEVSELDLVCENSILVDGDVPSETLDSRTTDPFNYFPSSRTMLSTDSSNSRPSTPFPCNPRLERYVQSFRVTQFDDHTNNEYCANLSRLESMSDRFVGQRVSRLKEICEKIDSLPECNRPRVIRKLKDDDKLKKERPMVKVASPIPSMSATDRSEYSSRLLDEEDCLTRCSEVSTELSKHPITTSQSKEEYQMHDDRDPAVITSWRLHCGVLSRKIKTLFRKNSGVGRKYGDAVLHKQVLCHL